MSQVSVQFSYNQVPTAGEWTSYFALCQSWSPILDQLVSQGGAPSFVAPAAWTPTDASGASLAFTGVSAEYTVVGNLVVASMRLTYPTTVDASNAVIGGLPYAIPNQGYAGAPEIAYVVGAAAVLILPLINTSNIGIYTIAAGAAVINSALSGKTIAFQVAYPLT